MKRCLVPMYISLAAILAGVTLTSAGGASGTDAGDSLTALEKRAGGRLGVAAVDTASGKRLEYRSGERFAMCSTFKLLLVGAVLLRVDAKKDVLDRRVPYGASDLLDYAPITKAHVQEGGMTLSALCGAAIQYSDNTAANLLLDLMGGPSALTEYARLLGDTTTRLDRREPHLNSNEAGDVRDTTTPAAMLETMRKLLVEDSLSAASRRQLQEWLNGNTTGGTRLRAGFPADWRVGDKTGTGPNGATNDLAIAWPPGRRPVLAAVYFTDSTMAAAERDAVVRDAAKIITAEFAQ